MTTKKQVAALKRVLKKDRVFTGDTDWYFYSNNYIGVILKEKIISENELVDYRNVSKQAVKRLFDHNFDNNIVIPSLPEIKNKLKEKGCKRSDKEIPSLKFTENDGNDIYFNPYYVIDVLEILNFGKDENVIMKTTGLQYHQVLFESEFGRAILMPIRVSSKTPKLLF